ncbi:MAG: CDP-alcohol phosphatidyltransferase family protein [Herpetosiphonaceae bacterium]|nr:CDP-alcohol phosphatidyltransferase family protein [Herpetosiphonaceae bacterium]
MIDHLLRQPKERMLAPVARQIGRRIHPTVLTLAAFGAGVGAAISLWQGATLAGLALWALNRALDGLDGTVARATNTQSDWGGYLDIMLDTVIYALIPLALALHAPSTALFIALALLLASFYVNAVSWTYLAAVLEKRQAGAKAQGELTSVTMPTGLIEGGETVVFFTGFILFPAALVWLFGLMAALVGINIIQRLIWAARAFGGQS